MQERQQARLLNYLANTVCQASKELFWILISTFSLAQEGGTNCIGGV
jgi:hypothetical protein